MFLMGMYIFFKGQQQSKFKYNALAFAVSFIMLIIERNILAKMGQSSVSYIFCTLPSIYFLFKIIVGGVPKFAWLGWPILGQMSKYIYLIHPVFMVITDLLQIYNTIIKSLVFMLLSLICSFVIVIIQRKRRVYAVGQTKKTKIN